MPERQAASGQRVPGARAPRIQKLEKSDIQSRKDHTQFTHKILRIQGTMSLF